MTEKECIQIKELRIEGHSFGYISKKTRLGINTIKNWCKRNRIKPLKLISYCPQCGKAIRGRKRKFCSDDCCNLWWKEHADQKKQNPKYIYTFKCAYCGKAFTSYSNKNRKYCSRDCYFKDRFSPA